jgi:hypothetical protein
MEGDEGSGPRLVVEVEPRDATGAATDFHGAISLMLVAPSEDEESEKLARWDYQPNDVQQAIDSTGGEGIRFHVELPSDAAIPNSSQLWVQLLPKNGGRLVTHAEVDLHQAGTFASHDGDSTSSDVVQDHEVMTAVYEQGSATPPMESEILDGGWSIALPGQPAGLPAESDAEQWRASLEPPPEAIATAQPDAAISGQPSPPRRNTRVASTRRKSAWSPDRVDRSTIGAAKAATRPSWSATR